MVLGSLPLPSVKFHHFFLLSCASAVRWSGQNRMTRRVIVINLHGGFPSCYVDIIFRYLDSFRRIREVAQVYTRVYPTNPIAACSLHDLIMDAPLGSMTDACWHPWSRPVVPQRSIFHVYKSAGYTTHLMGAYGIDANFDHHRCMRNFPVDLRSQLQQMGIDHFDSEDAAFTCRMGLAHDRQIIEQLLHALQEWKAEEKHMCVINLLACQDVHKCSWMPQCSEALVPVLDESAWMPDAMRENATETSLSANHIDGDPRRFVSSQRDGALRADEHALQRMSMLDDHIRGERHEAPGKEKLVRTVRGLHLYAWRILRALDEALEPLVDALLADEEASFIVTSDHLLSLYEHGVRCEAPWDACLRSFLTLTTPYSRTGKCALPIDDTPQSLAALPHLLLQLLNTRTPSWIAHSPETGAAVTMCVAPSLACRANVEPRVDPFALHFMWLRVVVATNDRVYALVSWWSMDELIESTVAAGWMKPLEVSMDTFKAGRVQGQPTWRLPYDMRPPNAVYDLSIDSAETNNLVLVDGWLQSVEAIHLVDRARRVAKEFGYDRRMRIQFPKMVHTLSPDEVAMCSVQVTPNVVRRRESCSTHANEEAPMPPPTPPKTITCDAEVQTEATVYFTRNSSVDDASPSPFPTRLLGRRSSSFRRRASSPATQRPSYVSEATEVDAAPPTEPLSSVSSEKATPMETHTVMPPASLTTIQRARHANNVTRMEQHNRRRRDA